MRGCVRCCNGWIEVVEVTERDMHGKRRVVIQRNVMQNLNDTKLGYEKLWQHDDMQYAYEAVLHCAICQPNFVSPDRRKDDETLAQREARVKAEIASAVQRDDDDLLPDRGKLPYRDE